MDDQIKTVAIIGGTHGNEAGGISLARHYQKLACKLVADTEARSKLNASFLAGLPVRSSAIGKTFETSILLGNIRAIAANVRYTEVDMNRCFLVNELECQNPRILNSYEHQRARQVNQLLGPKSARQPNCDYIFDLHNTTSNSRLLLCMHPHDALSHLIAAHLMKMDTSKNFVRVMQWPNKEPSLCPSIARSGMTFEFGPAPWGLVNHELVQKTCSMLDAALKFIDQINTWNFSPLKPFPFHLVESDTVRIGQNVVEVPVFRYAARVRFPRDKSGHISHFLHKNIDGQDFTQVIPGKTFIFEDLSGDIITFDTALLVEVRDNLQLGDEPLYAYFVNEAAYYEKDIAFCLATQHFHEIELTGQHGSSSFSRM